MIYRLTYPSGEYEVKGYLGIPDAPSLKTYPGIIYCRGGIYRVGMVNLHWIQDFINRGFVVLAPSYRGNEGGQGRDQFGGADVADTNAAVHILQALPMVQSNNISIMGFSRGAVNAFQTALQETSISRLVLWGGVSDLCATYDERPDLRKMLRRVVGGTPSKNFKAYQTRSAIWHVNDWRCKTLIMHGTNDIQVDVSHAKKLHQALKEAGKDTELRLYHGFGHHLPPQVHDAVLDQMVHWLNESTLPPIRQLE